jgi:predicted secreted protein
VTRISVGVRRFVAGPAVVAVAAQLAGSAAADGARACHHMHLNRTDSGQRLVLRVCDRVTIRLRQQFDSGYSWRVARAPSRSVLKLVSDRTVSRKGVVGGYDWRVFVYRAVGRGDTRLRLVESRSFQRHSPIARFRLAASVR